MSETKTMDLPNAIAAWEEVNGATYDPKDTTHRAAVFLLMAASMGTTNGRRVGEASGLTRSQGEAFASRARDQGIFVGRKIAGAAWFQDEGGMAFICDALCLSGMLERSPA